jgi:IclR family pca regulon transcriptional regulator
MSSERDDGQPSLGTVVKAFRLLEAFPERERFLSLAELSAATGLDKSAVQRLTRTLKELGYVEQDPATRRYALGRRLMHLAHRFMRSHPLIERALPLLVELQKATGERVDLVLPDEGYVLHALRLHAGTETARPALMVGRRLPTFCSAGGRAMLAAGDDAEAERMIASLPRAAFTIRTKTEAIDILDQVRIARRRGFAIEAGECVLIETTVAAAVIDRQSVALGAVSVTVSATDWSEAAILQRLVPKLVASATELGG